MPTVALNRNDLLSFFEEELELFGQRLHDTKQLAAVKAACHAALWAWTLDDHLKQTKGPTYADSDAAGEVVLGLRCARNRLLHQSAYLMEITHGWATGLLLALTASEVSWRPLADLPIPPRKHQNARLDQAYRNRLEGQLVRGILAEARDFFRSLPP